MSVKAQCVLPKARERNVLREPERLNCSAKDVSVILNLRERGLFTVKLVNPGTVSVHTIVNA